MPGIYSAHDAIIGVQSALGGHGGGLRYLFEDDFARADGDLGNGWEYTAGLWTVASEKAVGEPGLGANLIVNGTFDADASWDKGAGWSIGSGVAARDGTAGQSSLAQLAVLTIGRWYNSSVEIVSHVSGGGFSVRSGVVYSYYSTTLGTIVFIGKCAGTKYDVQGNAENGTIDNATAQEINLADMFATRLTPLSDIDVRAAVTCAINTCSGIVVCLDSKDSPANYLVAYVRRNGTGNQAVLDKVVSGTTTNLIAETLPVGNPYTDGRVLRVVKSGTTVSMYYNSVQQSTDKTVSDAGIIGNKRHGLFSTIGGSNRLDAFFCGTVSA